MKGMKYMALYADSYQEVVSTAAVTLKYDNHEKWARNISAHPRITWDECAIGLLRTLSINWT